MMNLPAFSLYGKGLKTSAPRVSWSAWLPALSALLLVACMSSGFFFGDTAPPAHRSNRALESLAHHSAVFSPSASAPGSETQPARALTWFNDARVVLSEEQKAVQKLARRARRAWGTGRAYPPAVDRANGRELYDAHIDVSDQFTSFGKVSVAILYAIFWVLLMFPEAFIPVGRPGIALAGGLITITYRYALERSGQGPVFDAENVIIMEPLYLLFGLMLTTVYLEKMERGGFFDKIRASLDDPIPWRRSVKIMAMSTIGSAAVMNDSIVLIFSGVVVDLCVRHRVKNSIPYLLSLATTANIGSALTMTGNPQNILITALAYDDMTWLGFSANMVLPVIAGTAINASMILVYYRAELFPGASSMAEALGMMVTGSKSSEMLLLERAYAAKQQAEGGVAATSWTVWSKVQVVLMVLLLLLFAAGLDVSVVCISIGLTLMTLNAWKRRSFDPKVESEDVEKKQFDVNGNEIVEEKQEVSMVTESELTLTEVDYGLLLLFIGQFLLIGSFDDTGVPQAFFYGAMGECAKNMTGVPCVYWFVALITLLSNIASNVPICQMLAASFPYATNYEWMQVSFSATVAGNLTMMGSAANMIVSFQACKVGDRTFTSERHAPFGIPSTIFVLYAGTAIMTVFHFAQNCSVGLGECSAQEEAMSVRMM